MYSSDNESFLEPPVQTEATVIIRVILYQVI